MQMVCSGNNASFNITASGTSPTYNWQVSTDSGTNMEQPFACVTYGNINPSIMELLLLNNYQYQVIVTGSGSCGNSVTSPTANIIGYRPGIYKRPTCQCNHLRRR
ncbi:MAG: hypothetical protein IPP81_11400 [Chitinophagaceae bacterium]|nr:hypothetical protein [Chitinophagaceae bacterium]